MFALGRIGSYITRGVYTVSGPFHPFGGAVDIIVVEQQDGSFKSSPWYVRFGKYQGVLKAKEKVVSINVNGANADFHMYLDHKGEAYFLREVGSEEEGAADVYPSSSGDEAEGKLAKRVPVKSKSYNSDANMPDLVSPITASNGKILARSASNQSKLFGVVFGRRSVKSNSFVAEECAADAVRGSSLERAEMAADLLEVKWSTNLASSRRRKSNASNLSDPKDSGNQESDGMMEEPNAQISCSRGPVSYMESFTLQETYLEVNFTPEDSRSVIKADNADPYDDENRKGDKSENRSPILSVSQTVQLEGNAETPFVVDEQSDQISRGRSLSEVGSRLDKVESFMYYEAVEEIMEASDASIEKINETVAFTASENGEHHVLLEKVALMPAIDAAEILGNGGCSKSLDESKGSADGSTPVASNGYMALPEAIEIATEPGNTTVDEGHAMAIDQAEEAKVCFSGVNFYEPSVVPEGELATELGSCSLQHIVDEGHENAVSPVEALNKAASGTTLNQASIVLESDVNGIRSEDEVNSSDARTTQDSLSLIHGVSEKENFANDLPRRPSFSNEEYARDNLKEIVIISGAESTSSEEELFRFSDLDDSNSQEVEMLESGSSVSAGSQSQVHELSETTVKEEELNKSGSIDPPSHHVELECDEEDPQRSRPIQVKMLERTSSPINIPEVHIEPDKEPLNALVESLPSMRPHVYDMKSHCVHPPRCLSLDSNLDNLVLIKKDVSLPSESDDEEAEPSTIGNAATEDSQIAEEFKRIVSDPAVELSLCRHLLYEGMGYEAASRAFDAEKLGADELASIGPAVLENDKLVVRIGGLYFPWEAALPIASAIGSTGSEQIVEPKGMIAVEQAEKAEEVITLKSLDSKNATWRLWPFSFQRSRSIKNRQLDLENPSQNASGSLRNTNSPRATRKSLRATTPTSEQLASLNLEEGKNVVTFTFSTAMLGEQQVDARIYLWKWNTKIVISDVDGTITKSDVLGQFMPLMGIDWSQTGVAHLFSAIKENGYQLLFLSARSILQAYHTRQFLFNLKQDGKALPEGPVVISPDGLFPSLYREVIRRAPHEFKIACLEDIKALFPSDSSPFYAGFGNRDTDEISYLKVGIPKGKIFIINPKGEIVVNRRVDTKSYTSLHMLVHDMFPPASSDEREDFNSWNFWRLPLPGCAVGNGCLRLGTVPCSTILVLRRRLVEKEACLNLK
ncbi:Phosphatidate phosphatase PAH2-like protein [Drosera capensis]